MLKDERDQLLSKFQEKVEADSPWRDLNNKTWYLNDGSLKLINEADNLHLFHPPKRFFWVKKKFFDAAYDNLSEYGVLIIRGPRRIGKTSTLKYTIKRLIEEGRDPKSFFYISLDETAFLEKLDSDILEEGIENIIKISATLRPIFIILDEVTFCRGWARAIKNLVDRGTIRSGICLIATGSHSIDLSSAKSELSGRYGKLGDSVNGEMFFSQRRFIEIAESLSDREFRSFYSQNIGDVGKRLGLLKYISGYSTQEDETKFGYKAKLDLLMEKFYERLHAAFEIYKITGGYPKAIFECTKSILDHQTKTVTDARYKLDIYDLLVSDSKKFKLSEDTLKRIMLLFKYPSMEISKDYSTFLNYLKEINLDELKKYLKYLKESGIISFFERISSKEEVDIASKNIMPKDLKHKIVFNDPAAFIAVFCCSRQQSEIQKSFEEAPKLDHDLLLESIVLSHLKQIPISPIYENVGYIKLGEQKEELADGLAWYYDAIEKQLIEIAVEVKNTDDTPKKITDRVTALHEFHVKRLIIVSSTKKLEIYPDYIIIPVELFLLLF